MTSTLHDDVSDSHAEEEKDLDISSPNESSENDADRRHPMEASEMAEGGAMGAELEKKATKFSVNNVSSIPNGGLTAWLQVLGAFFIFFNTWSVPTL